MTRPRMDGSARSCRVALAVAMKAMEAAPMGKMRTRAVARSGDSATATMMNAESHPDRP